MATEEPPAPLVSETWTTKEVIADLKADLVGHLNKQDSTLAEISTKVDSKADKSDLMLLSQKIDTHGVRITTLEEHRLEVESSKRFRNRVWAVVGSAAGVAAIIIGALIDSHIH